MYLPAHFRIDDVETTHRVITENPFATLITFDCAAPFATHLPLLFDVSRGDLGTLSGHVARGNAQWRHLEKGGEVLAIFHGPHAYVSPSWYEAELAVPTWNYIAVHAYATPRLLNDDELEAQLQRMVAQFEGGFAQPWPGELPGDFKAKLRAAIVGFDLEITRLEGKAKLSQNRSQADRAGVVTALEKSALEGDRLVARAMLLNP